MGPSRQAAAPFRVDLPATYVGGPFAVAAGSKIMLAMDLSGVTFFGPGRAGWQSVGHLPYTAIREIEVGDSKRITLTRVVLVGLWALAFRKKTVFLKLGFDDQGMPAEVVLTKCSGGCDMETLRGTIMQSRRYGLQGGGSS